MRKTYDTLILGCGEAGVFAAYELRRRCPGLQVLVVDQGRDIYHRSCPIVAGKVKSCIQCKVCGTMCGFGGAGAFSDGKYNFTTAFGGWLTDFMPEKEVMDLIDYVDEINVAHGATTQVFSTATPEAQALRREALKYDLHLLQARVKHLGTENNLRILTNLYEDLRTSPSSLTPPSPPSAGMGRATAWRPPAGTNTPPPSSSPPPAGPGRSGSPTSAAPWACP